MDRKLSRLAILAAACTLLALPAMAEPKTVMVEVRVDSEAPGYEGFRAMDGDRKTMWHTDWQFRETEHPHQITVDLGGRYEIGGFAYLPRTGCVNGTIGRYECYVSESPKDFGPAVVRGTFEKPDAESVVEFPKKLPGRYLRIRALDEVAGRPWTSIAELRVLVEGVAFRAKPSSEYSLLRPDGSPMDELEVQFVVLEHDLRKAAHFQRVAPETFHAQSLIHETDRDPVDVVLRRTAALLEDLNQMRGCHGHLARAFPDALARCQCHPTREVKVDRPLGQMPGAPDLAALERELSELQAAGARVDVADEEARLALFKRACGVRRKIAFSNPLVDFDKILFVSRHRAGFNHMCDQYYGVNAKPGGGLYVLRDPFGPEPQVRDVLADSVVERGRLAGQKLDGGSCLSPDLSFDARRIAFAYVECRGDTDHRHHTDPTRGHWHEGRCHHLFRVNVDGTGLAQLTDGTWNDFAPCWLPSGRIAFISERRGGYLRCGRVCPTYTLYDMAPDGTGLRCLSYHETNEWHPSVTHDGRIIFTRWDYVDRHGCTAHMPWITTVDGRDSRAVHGNFAPRRLRPDMELDLRAVPGSHKFLATAAPHHGQAFGSLVLVDPRVEDDDAMAPVKRITPEIGFPETQGGAQVYGTAWPLSEKYYLAVYDARMKPGLGFQGGAYQRGDYGIYLVDAFGNKELIYRDPAVACQSPIPLRPRRRPPVMPEMSLAHAEEQPFVAPPADAGDEPPEATVAVVDVYNSRNAWPEGTRIKQLRVIQILPMTVPSGRPPHETGLREPSSRDSVVLARYVLGTVPVEEDGSAHFAVPAHKEILFQALDEDGLAVQSMRSATYLQAGERLLCIGCHEPQHRSPPRPEGVPLAMRRSPSRLRPDVEGSNPFSYAHLVQPVLDRHCVGCHAEHPDKPMGLAREPIQRHWYASYANLAPDYGFWDYGDGHRTTPGRFGARAAKLTELLDENHYDVELPPEDRHRLTLWLDLCSIFYGVYEKEGGEAQLRGEVVRPTLE